MPWESPRRAPPSHGLQEDPRLAKTEGESMTQQAHDLPRTETFAGEVPAEARVDIAETVARSGLSLGSVRAAPSRLHSEGLVTFRNQRAAAASPPAPGRSRPT